MSLEPTNPDAEAAYDAEIAPLMEQVIAACKRHRIPVLACFQYGVGEDGGPNLCATRIPFAGESESLESAPLEE